MFDGAERLARRTRRSRSRLFTTALYFIVAIVLTGPVNYRTLNVPDSLAVGIDATDVRWGSLLVKIGALGGLSSTMVVMLLGQSRGFFSMSKDGLLPKVFSKVHPKFRTSWISSLFVGLVVAGFDERAGPGIGVKWRSGESGVHVELVTTADEIERAGEGIEPLVKIAFARIGGRR